MVPVESPAEPEAEVPAEPEPEPQPEPIPQPEPEPEPAFEWWMVAVALGVFVLGSGGTLLVFNNKHLKKMKIDEEEEEE